MLSFLQKFNNLPKEIKDAVASPEAAALIAELGAQYQVDLATTVMKVVVKEISLDGLGAYLINQMAMSREQAIALEKDLRKKVFSNIIDYLLGPAAGPKLVFSESDEKEVKAAAQPVATVDFDAAVEEALTTISEKTRINFSDPLLSGKFKQVLKTYLRSTRDRAATMEVLTKAGELGGVALSRDAAERAMFLADTELNALQKIATKPTAAIPVPEDISSVPQRGTAESKSESPFKRVNRSDSSPVALAQGEYDLEAVLKSEGRFKAPAEIAKTQAALKPITDPAHELEPLVPAVTQEIKVATAEPVRTIIKEAVAAKAMDKTALRKVAAAPKTPAPIINLTTSPSGKIRMDDIRFTPQVLSPVDELRYMTVKNFRRLNPDPLKAIEKIKEKLELLAKDDYGKKIEGIVAWNESPLSKLYVSLCRRALEENKPVTDILKDELKKEPESLKPEELSAIIALNRQLKF
jgi:hypothetical protein